MLVPDLLIRHCQRQHNRPFTRDIVLDIAPTKTRQPRDPLIPGAYGNGRQESIRGSAQRCSLSQAQTGGVKQLREIAVGRAGNPGGLKGRSNIGIDEGLGSSCPLIVGILVDTGHDLNPAAKHAVTGPVKVFKVGVDNRVTAAQPEVESDAGQGVKPNHARVVVGSIINGHQSSASFHCEGD